MDQPLEKRIRVAAESPWSSWISSTPNSTLLVFNIPPAYSNDDVFNLFKRYGNIKAVEKVPQGDVALVDFIDVHGAASFMQTARNNPFYVGANFAQIEYCCHKLLDTMEALSMSKVLHFEVTACQYPITIEVLTTICQSHAPPIRLLIGPIKSDNSLESLIEFDSPMNAKKVRDALHGNDIYSGCCSLNVAMSGFPTLLLKPDGQSWDYSRAAVNPTTPQPKVGLLGDQPRTPLTAMPPPSYVGPTVPHAAWPPADYYSLRPPPGRGPPPGLQSPFRPPFYPPFPPYPPYPPMKPSDEGTPFVVAEGCVVFFNNLSKDFNCDRLFNMTCLYGNVIRVKFLWNKDGVAMVQMGNPDYAKNLLRYLNGLKLFDKEVTLAPCKHHEIVESSVILNREDGTPSIKNYIKDANNRFRTPATASKSRIMEPAATLHFFNAPPNISEEILMKKIEEKSQRTPQKIAIFPMKPGQKSGLGLIEFSSISEAVESLIYINNMEIQMDGVAHPFHLKVAFSAKPIDQELTQRSSLKRVGNNAANENGDLSAVQ